MTRLFDKIISESKFGDVLTPRFWEVFKESEVVAIDNVSQFFFADSPKTEWHVSDFPNVAPPFSKFFMEWHSPKVMNLNGNIQRRKSMGRLGVFFSVEDVEDVSQKPLKWVYESLLFGEFQNRIAPLSQYRFIVNNDGTIAIENDKWIWGRPVEGGSDFVDGTIGNCIFPCLLAVSFFHCKNVTLHREIPPVPLSKKYEKKHGWPLVSYHTLNIEPMKKVLRTEGDSQQTGLKQALHICRGHFKDFSKGKGLFGKYKGLYWWDSVVRGSVSEGIIDKDYAVKPPRNEAAL